MRVDGYPGGKAVASTDFFISKPESRFPGFDPDWAVAGPLDAIGRVRPLEKRQRRQKSAIAAPAMTAQRALDVVVAIAAGFVFLPVMAFIVLLIKAQGDGPVLFSQERIGLNGKPFRCFKFRSMVTDAETHLASLLASDPELAHEWRLNRKLRCDPRITAIGAFLRKTSLDELPQIYNILRGEMSVVGPRPILASEAGMYARWIDYYLAVKPGLTGLWQVSGRNNVSYRRRVAMDRAFAVRFSIKLYLFIILATIPAVLLRRGSY